MSELNSNMLVMFGWKNEQFEDTKGVIRSPNSQKDRQLSNRKKTNVIYKHHTENYRVSKTNAIKNPWKCKQ